VTWEASGRAGSGPDNDGTCRYCQMVRVRQARREGVREKPVSRFRKRRAGSNLVDMGRGAVRDRWDGWAVNSEAGEFRRWGGHGEGLRRSRGDAAGTKLGISLVDRYIVNVGTIRGRPTGGVSSLAGGRFVVG
jgi:hypothetical protein